MKAITLDVDNNVKYTIIINLPTKETEKKSIEIVIGDEENPILNIV
ncbi:hypothetical protein [uncultured Kordia sp.]|nr:hypothetical protein [uncultured Kordia sp.]